MTLLWAWSCYIMPRLVNLHLLFGQWHFLLDSCSYNTNHHQEDSSTTVMMQTLESLFYKRITWSTKPGRLTCPSRANQLLGMIVTRRLPLIWAFTLIKCKASMAWKLLKMWKNWIIHGCTVCLTGNGYGLIAWTVWLLSQSIIFGSRTHLFPSRFALTMRSLMWICTTRSSPHPIEKASCMACESWDNKLMMRLDRFKRGGIRLILELSMMKQVI